MGKNISNMILENSPRSVEYLGRKALRSGIRKAIQNVMAKIGGRKLVEKITERAILKMIVPGVNIHIASFANKRFTKSLGENAIKTLKSRGATIRVIDKLAKYERYYQIITIPIVFHIGIFDEDKKRVSTNIEMQHNIVRRILIQEDEEQIINDLIELEIGDFCSILSGINNEEVAKYLVDMGILFMNFLIVNICYEIFSTIVYNLIINLCRYLFYVKNIESYRRRKNDSEDTCICSNGIYIIDYATKINKRISIMFGSNIRWCSY